MTSRLGPRLLAAALPVVLLLPGAAHAEKVVTEDAIGDVQLLDAGSDEDYVPAPDYVTSDISRTVAAYGTRRLEVTVHFRDLLTTSLVRTDLLLRTPRAGYVLSVVRVPGQHAITTFGRPRRGPLECRGVVGRFDGAADTVTVSVPAACFGSPRWVRLGVAALGAEEADLDADDIVFHLDDGHDDAMPDSGMTKGPRIRRG